MTPGEGDGPAAGSPVTLVVDGNNVMGATADGWWRDRAGAGRRLVARVERYATATGRPVTVVFDQPVAPAPGGGPAGSADDAPVTVLTARRRGRDAADDRIVELVATLGGAVEVVTSDRGLAARVSPRAEVTGAGTFLRRLDDHGC